MVTFCPADFSVRRSEIPTSAWDPMLWINKMFKEYKKKDALQF